MEGEKEREKGKKGRKEKREGGRAEITPQCQLQVE